ncbi:hypothetical protein LCGC14_1994730, partial [marine sediment metagenome]
MRNKLNKHPCWVAMVTALLIFTAFIGSTVIAGISDRSSKIDLVKDPHNYIRMPNIGKPSRFLRPDVRTRPFDAAQALVSGTTNPGQTGRNQYNTPASEEAWLGNDEGNLMYKGEVQLAIAGRTVIIDSVKDLTTLGGETSASGNSIFFMDWGNHYIVDLWSIAFSGGTDSPVAGTTSFPESGISGIFRSVLQKDDQKTITVEIAQTGNTGFVHLLAGATVFTVWAPLNSGATTYNGDPGAGVTNINNGDSGVTHQTMMISPNQITNVTDGGVDLSVRFLGDKKTWKAQYLAGVSVIPVEETIVND